MPSINVVIELLRSLASKFPYPTYEEKFYKRRSFLDTALSSFNHNMTNKEIPSLVQNINIEFYKGMEDNQRDILIHIYKFLINEINSK